MKKVLDKINLVFGSVLIILTLQQPVNADEIYTDTVKWLATVMNERTLDSILSDSRFSNLKLIDIEQDIADLLLEEQSDTTINMIADLQKKQKEMSLRTKQGNKETSVTITHFKNEYGGYGQLIVGSIYSDEHSEAYPEYFDRNDQRWNNCDNEFAPIRKWLNEPNVIRDLSFDPPTVNGLGWYSDTLDAEWRTPTLSLQFGCTKVFVPLQFYNDGETVNDLDHVRAKDVQTALNFFGFSVGSPDGVFGTKSRNALSSMQKCLGQLFDFGGLLDNETEFLVQSYQKLQSQKSVGSCKDLKELLPQKLLFGFSTVNLTPIAYAEELKPITWLNCTLRNRNKDWRIDNTTDSEEIYEAHIFGVDFGEEKLLAKNGNTISSNVDISETEIIGQKQQSADDSEYFDKVENVIEIDRLTGSISYEANFFLAGKLQVKVTETGSCDLLKVENRKF